MTIIRRADYPHPYDVFPNGGYISICVPTFCRPFYLKKLLTTLAHHADMPYEVVVCDDGSRPGDRQALLDMSNMISLTIFNNGFNAGLTIAANRAIQAATSKYILFLNDDCFFEKPCLKDICNALSKPYVGIVSPMDDVGILESEAVCNVNGTKIALANLMGGGSTLAFRKEVWAEVGGWDERTVSSQADNVFFFKILKAGYWKALMGGPLRVKTVNNDVDYVPTQPITCGNDCSIPKIFGLSMEQWIYYNHKRREACQSWVDTQRVIPNRNGFYDDVPNPEWGLNDIPGWGNYFLAIFGGKHSHNAREIDWNKASIHGQDKWRELISQDFNLSK